MRISISAGGASKRRAFCFLYYNNIMRDITRTVMSKGRHFDISGINIRRSHPGLYRSITIISFMSIALALNFYFAKPTFNPYGINKEMVGSVFVFLGFSKLFFLNFYRNLKLVRFFMALSVGFMFFWGASNTQQGFAGKASFQLPIVYMGLALIQATWVVEPSVNPVSRRKK